MSDSNRSSVRRFLVNADEGRLRAGWRLLVGVLVFLVAVFAGSLVGIGVQAGLAGLLAVTLPLAYVGQFCWNVLATVLYAAAAVLVDERRLPDLGLGGPGWWRNLGFGLVLGVVMTTVLVGAELAAGLVAVEVVLVTTPLVEGGSALPFALALALSFVFFVAVGVGEEVFVRGYLMTNLAEGLVGRVPFEERGAVAAAAVLTSALFGFLHFGNSDASLVSTLNVTLVGLFFAAAYVVTDDLGLPIGVHVTWNFSLGSVYGLPVSGNVLPVTLVDLRQTGDPVLTGGGFGPEAGLVLYVALAVGIALTWWWVRREEGAVRFRESVAVPDLR